MATLKHVRIKLEGPNWPSNPQPDCRFLNVPVGSPVSVNQPDVWKNCPSSSTLTFNGNGYLVMYMNGAPLAVDSAVINPYTPQTNAQANFNTSYGMARVQYNVVV